MLAEWVIRLAAIYLFGLAILAIILNPFFIGKERKPYYSAGSYLFEMTWSACVIIVVGRLLEWW